MKQTNQQNTHGQHGQQDQGQRIDLSNYVPDASKRNDLKRRLYDSGISNIPMPSVKRPIEENLSSRPYSAKMNPNKIQSLSPLKKKIDSITKNIYSNLQESYKEAAAQEAKYKGEGTAEYYKSQHIMVPPPQILQGPKKGATRLVPKLGHGNEGPVVQGLSSTNRILLNKGASKPNQLPSLKASGFGAGTAQLDPNMRLLQGPPAMVMAGFEGGYSMNQKNLELARSKFLLDKLTGKLPPELRHGRGARLPPLSESARDGAVSRGSRMSTKSVKQPDNIDKEDEEEKKDVAQQKWSDLDKYIELLLDAKSEEETVFVYLNPNLNGDPYDLQVCQYKDREPQKYYTLSGKGLTLYENDTPIEFLSLGQWLVERDSYNHIKELDFFKKFKKWKFMRMWKKTIKHQNRMKAQTSLEEKLFMLQPHFGEHLAAHRVSMIEMEKRRFVDLCPQGDTKTLGEFAAAQSERTEEIHDEIQKCSDKCRENIRGCISEVLAELRTKIVNEMALDDERKKNNPIQSSSTSTMKRKASTNVFEKLGFPEGMTYGHRSSLRKEFSRFLRFAYLIDFLSLEALTRIYTGSVGDMVERLARLDEGCNMEEVMKADYSESNQAAGPGKAGKEPPLFHVSSKLCDDRVILPEQIVLKQIAEFVLPPRGTSQVHEFEPLCHLELEEPKPEGEEEEEPEPDEAPVAPPIWKQTVPRIEEYWLAAEPDEEAYIDVITRTFGAGLEQIKNFERWSKHEDLTPYADALEEWDDIVGDSWEAPDSVKLDPKTWIEEDPIYEEQRPKVKAILESAFRKMKDFLSRFQPLLEIYWSNKQIDLKILVDERLKNPIEGLQNTIRLFQYQKELFSSKLPTLADIGLIQLDCRSTREKIRPTPENYTKQLEEDLPLVIKARNDESKRWLEARIRDLEKQVFTVEDFVERTTNYTSTCDSFQNVRDRVDMYGQVYNVLAEFSLKVPKEDKDSFNETISAISKLAGYIQKIETEQEGNKEKFKKTLNELIPKLDTEINELFEKAKQPKYLDGDNMERLSEVLQELDAVEATFKQLEERKETYNKWQEVLETQPTIFENLDECREQLSLRCLMWRSLAEWQEMNEQWYKTRFTVVDAKDIAAKADKYAKNCLRIEKNLDPNPIAERLKGLVSTFKEAMPIVTALRNDKLSPEHWAQIKALVQKDFDTQDENFTLKSLIDLDVNKFQEQITSISTQATQEHNLRSQLADLDELWKKLSFPVEVDPKTECPILKDLEEIYTNLDESLASINQILGSRFVKPLRPEAELWKRWIVGLSDMLDQWVLCQRNWKYLENIFKAADIKRAMPDETKKFDSVDKSFKTLMLKTAKNPSCLRIIKQSLQGPGPGTMDQLVNNNEILDEVQKKLEDYMETKREAFPRFFFLSNDELIDILANSQNLEIVQQHLRTCFDNISKLQIPDMEEGTVLGMHSGEKELVAFKNKAGIKTLGNVKVEEWLAEVQKQMIETLREAMKAANTSYRTAEADYQSGFRKDFVTGSNPGQVVATVCQIAWTRRTEEAIEDQRHDPSSLQSWLDQNVEQLEKLTELVRGELTELQRKIVVALITVDVHARDIVEELKEHSVSSAQDFRWQKQLKYSWDEDVDDVRIRQVSATLSYGYEYMGATSRLVITPLTDRCWITISNALHIKLGANPAGPAGTGKTESTKDLAKAIAIQCIVYNCSDQVDYIMMARLFSGLCQQGCWTCLDEFNRIDIEVLSVIAQQLQQVRTALLERKERFVFDTTEMKIKQEFGCHVTMNPGYAGRTELPDNLKVMFRPVAMMIPDYGLIAEIMLFAEGFGNAKILSKKMVQLYKLSSEQLSQQDHYDFGLRAVKSVLVMAGALKRANPDLIEDGVLIRAMRDANVPKFLKDDLPLFGAIIQDLFPAVEITENDYGPLKVMMEEMIERRELIKHPPFVTKVIQLFETFNVRFGVMLVGPTGSGKTSCYEILQDTFDYLREIGHKDQTFQHVKKIVLNPKAISMGEMYGYMNISQEWFDGLASKVMRAAAQDTSEDKTWVVFDGPVDALWIENMNTVLDDNMTLCLSNGQRIKLRSQMRMLFEVQDLAVASPATVSRCGMVYLTVEELGWRPYVTTWIKTFFRDEELMPNRCKEYLRMLFDATIDLGLEFIGVHCSEPIKTTDLQQVVSLCNFLESFISEKQGFKGKEEDKIAMLNCLFAWSYAWGLGGSLEQRGKERFDGVVRDQFKSAQIPSSYTVYDYWYDLKKEKVFKPWSQKVEQFVYDKDLSYFDLMVPTQDTTKYAYSLEALLLIEKPIFFTGSSGVGKSAVIANQLSLLKDKNGITPININMSAQTSSARTQQSIEEKLDKKKRSLYGAAPGKKLAIFVDDINMPSVEEYGAQPPIELLRLFLDRKGMYQRADWSWIDVEDTTIIGCAAPPSGGRAVLTPRFTRRFNMFCLPEASAGTLATIFSSILKGFLGTGFAEKVRNLEEAAISSAIEIYTKIQEDLRPTPAKFHYLFNLRDVSKVVQGICMTKPVSIQSDDTFMRLFVNEAFRVFYDRLINDDDRKWFKDLVMELLGRNFKMTPDRDELFASLRFGDLLKLSSPVPYYEYIQDKTKLIKGLHESLEEYNMSNSNKMNLVLFDDALEHVLRIARCLKQPRGHIMLIGVGGSGKQSLIRLCTYMRGMLFTQVELSKNYGVPQFQEYMKGLMKDAGIDGKTTSFVMTDTQIVNESFVENLNNLLNTGEIPNLMLPDDKEAIVAGVRPICIEKKLIDSPETNYALFVSRVRENLHICLCMSPVGETLRVRCRQFPSLVNCCTLDWFSRWPEEALLFVSSEFLKELPDTSAEVKAGLAEMCMRIHTSVEHMSTVFYESLRRRVYTTPKSYLDLISLYLQQLEKKRAEFLANKNRLAIGLKKLNDTNSNIAELKIKLAEMQPILVQKNEDLKAALVIVNADKKVADEKDKVVSAEAEIVGKKQAEAKVIRDDAQADLAAAEPELVRAQNSVKNLDKNAVNELRSFTKPPERAVWVMECIMVLLDEKQDWATVKGVLGNVTEFMRRLLTFDVEKTPEKVWKKAREGWIDTPKLDTDAVRSSSLAAAALCDWAKCCSRYQIVVKKIAPKKAKLAEVEAICAQAEAELNTKLGQLAIVKEKVAKLEADCQKMQDEKEALEFEMDRSSSRMKRAEKLVVLLADEGVRWKQTVEVIVGDIERLVGNVFVSAACISYFGAFTGPYREKLVAEWVEGCLSKGIPTSENFSLATVMGDPVGIRSWGIAGLPADQVSVENGLLTTKAERYALCIDPQQQANKWIKNMETDNQLALLKFGVKDFQRAIAAAVSSGRPALVEDVEESIDPALDPVLMKQAFKSDAGIWQIRLGDANVDYDANFRLFMTTKMPNPHYIPEVCIKVTLINFTVTFDGLQQQLLADVVVAEKPEIEAKRDAIVLTMAADAKTLKDLENTILELLSKATLEEILDEDKLIDILESSKKTAIEINERMDQSKLVEVEINETRNLYAIVAVRGSILYFVVADLGGIDPMYQNSLVYVKSLFNKAIELSPQRDTIEGRLATLIDRITSILYTNVARGLFEKDKLIYSFLIASSIQRNAKHIEEPVWNLLLRGPGVFTAEQLAARPDCPDPELVGAVAWDTLYTAELVSPHFTGIAAHVCSNWSVWREWADSEGPFEAALPGRYAETLSGFDRLVLVKVFRPELVQMSCADYIISDMGKFYAESPPASMEVIFEDLSKTTPLIFVLSAGADPTSQLQKFASDKGFRDEKWRAVSLGQGQGPRAEGLIKRACLEGHWVLLQNCHLARSWMESLEQIVLHFSEQRDAIHEDFRLYLTSMPASYFPVSVLQNSVKLTTEPPRGMKANLRRTYANMSQRQLEDCAKPAIWRKLLFSFSFFHAVVQERRKFGPLGWNIRYEFNDSDLDTSFTMLKLFLEPQGDIPWDALLFVTGHINYGGRVTDDLDRRCLLTVLEKFCSSDCLNDGYKYSKSGIYQAPADGPLEAYRTYIESLPMNDNPEIFGLHDNANITFQRDESDRVIASLLSIQPRLAAVAGGMTPDELVLEKARDILQRLPEVLDKKGGSPELFATTPDGLIPSLSTVLLQEMEKFNRLLGVMRTTLGDIDLAIKGFIVMGSELDSMYVKLQNNQVPVVWAKVAYPSLKPLGAWIADLIERVAVMAAWLQNGNPSAYWMPGLFFPQGFLTGVLQTHARQYKIAIDKLAFAFEILGAEGAEDIDAKPDDGVYIYGLFLDGARWDRETALIADQLPAKMAETMPVLWFKPQEDYKPDPEEYQAPCYKTSVRAGTLSTTGQSTNHILNVSLPTKDPPAQWVQRAAALLCMLNE